MVMMSATLHGQRPFWFDTTPNILNTSRIDWSLDRPSFVNYCTLMAAMISPGGCQPDLLDHSERTIVPSPRLLSEIILRFTYLSGCQLVWWSIIWSFGLVWIGNQCGRERWCLFIDFVTSLDMAYLVTRLLPPPLDQSICLSIALNSIYNIVK